MLKNKVMFVVSLIIFIMACFGGYKIYNEMNLNKKQQQIQNNQNIKQELQSKQKEDMESKIYQKYKPAENHYLNGDYTDAIKICNQIIVENPKYSKAYNLKGICMVKNSNYLNGMPLIDKSLQLNPSDPFAIYCKAAAYDEFARYDDALKWYLKHLKYGDYLQSDYGVAKIYALKGNEENAIKYLKIAVDMNSDIKDIVKNAVEFKDLKNNNEFNQLVGQ